MAADKRTYIFQCNFQAFKWYLACSFMGIFLSNSPKSFDAITEKTAVNIINVIIHINTWFDSNNIMDYSPLYLNIPKGNEDVQIQTQNF